MCFGVGLSGFHLCLLPEVHFERHTTEMTLCPAQGVCQEATGSARPVTSPLGFFNGRLLFFLGSVRRNLGKVLRDHINIQCLIKLFAH